jgi:hypothetical protein
MPRGGARPGAGRPRKPLAEKLAAGNPGHHPLKKVDFGPGDDTEINPPDYLDEMHALLPPQANLPTPRQIFLEDVAHLRPSCCLRLIPAALLAEHAMAKYYLLVAQWELSQTALTSKDEKTQRVLVTSFTEAMLKMQKNCAMTWNSIWTIVQRNAEQMVTNPEEDLMLDIIAARQRTKKSETGGK